MPFQNSNGTQHLAGAVTALLSARIAVSNDYSEQSNGDSYQDDLTVLINAKFSSSKIHMDALVAFLRTPDDTAARDAFRRALKESADSSQEFRDQLVSAIKPHGPEIEPKSPADPGAHNTTTVTHSTIKGRGINLGILTKSKRTRIGLGLGGLVALAALGGGVFYVVISPSQPNRQAIPNRGNSAAAASPTSMPSAISPLADGQYMYMGVLTNDDDSCDDILFRWTTKDGYGIGSMTMVSYSAQNSGSNSTLTVEGEPSNLTFTIGSSMFNQQMVVAGAIKGNKLTANFPLGSDGETEVTLKRGTSDQWAYQTGGSQC